MEKGLRNLTEYLEILQKFYPNIPFEKIKKIERKHCDESKMKEELSKLNENLSNRYISKT